MSEKRPRLLVSALIAKPDSSRCILLTQHLGSRRWHFPDGEVRFGESLVEVMRRSLTADLCFTPGEIDMRACMQTENFYPGKGLHFMTSHYIVQLPVGLQLMPKKGFKIYWYPMDVRYRPNDFLLMDSTVEVLRRLSEEK